MVYTTAWIGMWQYLNKRLCGLSLLDLLEHGNEIKDQALAEYIYGR